MVKSQAPGAPSSARSLLPRDEVEASLSVLVETPALSLLSDTLGEIFLVGGTVRDAFYGDERKDIDLASALSPTEVVARCKARGIRVVETGIEHGTVLAVIENAPYEITSFREPSDRSNYARAPSIEEDLGGRDFTINAIAFNAATKKLIDPFDGIGDLTRKVLRAVGVAENRFAEDPLRVLRMVRFGPAAGRTVSPETQQAAASTVPALKRIAPERIRVELTAILTSDHPADAMRTMLTLGILQVLLPEILPAVGFEQNEFHIHDVFEHTLWVLERCPPDPVLRWTALFHDLGKPPSFSVGPDGRRHFYRHEHMSEEMCKERLTALRFSNEDVSRISLLVRHHMRPIDCGPAGVRRLLRDLGSEFDRWFAFKYADATPKIADDEVRRAMSEFQSAVETELERARKAEEKRLAINGNDLIALGMRPGKALGGLLKELEEVVIEDPTKNTRDTLLDLARQRIQIP